MFPKSFVMWQRRWPWEISLVSPFDIVCLHLSPASGIPFRSSGTPRGHFKRHEFNSDYTLVVHLGGNRLDRLAASYAEVEKVAFCPGWLFFNGSDPMCTCAPRLGPCYSDMGDQQYDSHLSTDTPLHPRRDPSQRDCEQVCTRQSSFLQLIVSFALNAMAIFMVKFLISLLVYGFKKRFF